MGRDCMVELSGMPRVLESGPGGAHEAMSVTSRTTALSHDQSTSFDKRKDLFADIPLIGTTGQGTRKYR